MQPTGRPVPGSARALIADGDQWNVGQCGRGRESPQLVRMSLATVLSKDHVHATE